LIREGNLERGVTCQTTMKKKGQTNIDLAPFFTTVHRLIRDAIFCISNAGYSSGLALLVVDSEGGLGSVLATLLKSRRNIDGW